MEGGCSNTSKNLFNGVPPLAYLRIFAGEQDNQTLVNNFIASLALWLTSRFSIWSYQLVCLPLYIIFNIIHIFPMEMIASYTHDLNLNQTPLNKNFTATNVTSTYLLLRSPLVQYAKCMILNYLV